MKKINPLLYLFVCLLFVFSCNTEEKFGFRKKIKVDGQPLVEAKAKRTFTKPEIISEITDSIETTEATTSSEKIILSKIEKHVFYPSSTFSDKKILIDSTKNKNRYYEEITPIRKLNILALVGFLVHPVLLLGYTIGVSLQIPIEIAVLLIMISFIFSLFGLIQILRNPKKYYGLTFAILGVVFFLLITIYVLISLSGFPRK